MVLRIAAVISIALWLMRVAACDFEQLLGLELDETAKDQARPASHVAVAHHDDDDVAGTKHSQSETNVSEEGHSHGSHNHHHDGKDDSCCSTLKAIVQTPNPIVIAKPLLHPLNLICALLAERDLCLFHEWRMPAQRHAKIREWVFTPEVCLGPATRSHAPPVFI